MPGSVESARGERLQPPGRSESEAHHGHSPRLRAQRAALRPQLPLPEDEMFSDIYKIREVANGLCLEVEGKMVTRTEGQIDDSLIGGNASAEGPEGDGTEATVITGVDIVINHHLQETSFTKESYKKYIKDYMKAIKARLEEHKPERVKPFMTGAAEQIKHILANFKNYQFFVGENMNPDGMVALLDFREDGVTPYMIFFKDGLEIEKC
ncbi:translationally-controlled tumor protein isoform X1 [Numenius arquata]|uniref:translationally-controlled tumor protein isoform X1 n=1 Tax=Numenius arquata TaxID=31919 RepID=UPI003D306359